MYNPDEIARTTEETMAFLRDSSRHELRLRAGNHTYLLFRSSCDEETDFLYLLHSWGDAEPRTLHDDAEFAGVYSRLHGRIVGASLYLRDIVDEAYIDRLDDALNAVYRRAEQLIVQMIAGGPVPETDESGEPSHSMEHFVSHELEKEAIWHFMLGTAPEYIPRLNAEDTGNDRNTAATVQIINHPEDAARSIAQRHIALNAKRINQRMREIPLVARRILELAATPGDHHLRRAIARSIGDEKMVRLDLERDGQIMTVRIEADALKCAWNSHYSTWRMDAHSRAAFSDAFGRGAELLPSDIRRITYGNRMIYSMSRVNQSETVLSPAQFAAVFGATPVE